MGRPAALQNAGRPTIPTLIGVLAQIVDGLARATPTLKLLVRLDVVVLGDQVRRLRFLRGRDAPSIGGRLVPVGLLHIGLLLVLVQLHRSQIGSGGFFVRF